ncbi:MAG: B12-binding domain-containing radical SAM protein [Nitrospinae bacterium]|nr:B12-binding domain-containing radical SAM protein [Nitrospinota bacterium]
MKVLLLRPAAEKKSMARVLPLGLLAFGSVLKRAGHEIKILDLRISHSPDEELESVIKSFDPAVVGIGVMTIECKYGFIDAEKVKRIKPEVTVIFGGPHCSHEPRFILNNEYVDLMVSGEGELTIVELIRALEDGGDVSNIPGIAYKKDGTYIRTAERPVIRDLDTITQEYDLIDLERYFNFQCSMDFFPVFRNRRFIPLMTSRGCPFKCTYCHDIFDKSIQYRSPEVVVDEMEYLLKTYGIREFHIVDDVFNVNMKRAKIVLDVIIKRNLNVHISFPNGLRADFFDDELIDKMRRAGVYRMAIGIESGSQRIQDMIKKDLDIGILHGVIDKLTRARISVHGFFMLGFPTETRSEMEETIDFACNLGLTTANFSLVIPNPGTDLRQTFIESRERNFEDFSEYTFDAASCNASEVEGEELIKLKREANRRFYLSARRFRHVLRAMEPKWLLRSMVNTPFALLWRNAIAPTNAPTEN